MRRQSGFTLIELLIVVGIILIVAAIAIPSLLRSRMVANEAVTASALKTIGTANVVYYSLFNRGYAGSLANLGPTRGSCPTVSAGCADLIDALLSGVSPATATPAKNGYRFTYYPANSAPTSTSPNPRWAAVATPVSPGSSGVSTFCFDSTNVIWKDISGGMTTATAVGCAATWPVTGNIGPN